ncbi:MAG TPA: hypothetical protein VFG53_13655 [Anaeromyxobacter sp.]|nr:hypothetical protein [Anaeromyxobacter sp.]
MSRLAPLLVATVAVFGCGRKEEIVVAAPTTPPSRATSPAPAMPAPAPGAELPPGHPPLPGSAPKAGGEGGGAAMQGGAAPPHGAAMSQGADVGDVKVPKATSPDACTIAELFAERAALKGKTVSVRGKVVKFNPAIMGKNWIHLRDGTGTAGKDNDVTVTSQEEAKLGAVVTVQGIVAVDQDIGMGTPYPVIIQDAKVTQ